MKITKIIKIALIVLCDISFLFPIPILLGALAYLGMHGLFIWLIFNIIHNAGGTVATINYLNFVMFIIFYSLTISLSIKTMKYYLYAYLKLFKIQKQFDYIDNKVKEYDDKRNNRMRNDTTLH